MKCAISRSCTPCALCFCLLYPDSWEQFFFSFLHPPSFMACLRSRSLEQLPGLSCSASTCGAIMAPRGRWPGLAQVACWEHLALMWLRTGRTFALGRPDLRTQQAAPVSVAIDAHMVGTHETGNETYVVQLASALARLGGYEYKLYTPLPQAI